MLTKLMANFVFCQTNAPADEELAQLAGIFANCSGHYLERQGLLERDAGRSYLVDGDVESGPMTQPQGTSITYRVAVGSQ